MSNRCVVALLGRRDAPTDAVEEYCRYLGGALHGHGFEAELVRVPWAEKGWPAALRELQQCAKVWRGHWVLVQYTALAWSTRGLPRRFGRVLNVLRDAGVRVAVVFHDVEPYGGARIVDRLRRRAQLHSMRQGLRDADLAVFTVPLNLVSWLGDPPGKARFLPIGANLPLTSRSREKSATRGDAPMRIAVFGITGGETGKKECQRIIDALSFATSRLGKLSVHALGRGADECESELREGLSQFPIDVHVEGVLPAERVVEALHAADVMLFVREPISSRRGSAIAGISCGLPVIAYSGPHTAPPVTDAGVLLVSRDRVDSLGEALVRVLADVNYRETLAQRSRLAYQQHFSWDAIAERYAAALNDAT
jgi:glycosyltransferase involved in cell wall biosynthesis